MIRRPTLPRLLACAMAMAAHLFPLLLCALLLAVAAIGTADAQERPETPAAAPACETGTNALPALERDGRLEALRHEAAATPNGTGRLWRVERAGVAPSFLFGTMHLSDPRILALPAPAEAALASARRVVIETTDVLDPAAMAAALLSRPDLTTLKPGETLETLLGSDELARLAPLLAERSLPLAAIRTLQPWFVTMSLTVPPCEAARVASGAAVLDVALAARAKAAGQPVAGLESAVEQITALASLPLDMQADNLVASAEMADRLPDLFETMIALYLRDEIALIEPATTAMEPAGTDDAASIAITQRFEETVVRQRNGVMTERLGPLLTDGGQFVAVGALHLPGETGLVEALRRAGWQVTRAD
ncbi:TraB/GumN family protein [Aureimonas pseudogalii]|uniref:Polysaccharide biosynthesis protein GumN n=1 Tax=Aureimonas pseudogalii TaxID=1744844 RepID=A0A7W6EAW8_9HYPH|nr:TraB/GumN family protein [Aureimonas pseudogalii]MBB3997494.1 hypothetical protein [Aureimonas pseudogalii]